MKKIIKAYFDCWLQKDDSRLNEFFSDDAVYIECYGPEYVGKAQIIRWFRDWNKIGTVLQWDITDFIEQGSKICVEWNFKYIYDGNTDEFNGVTIAEFDRNNQICNLREFESKSKHYNPYEE